MTRAVGWRERLGEFVCHRCGNCCKGEGMVWLRRDDIHRIADHLGLGIREFLRTHTRLVDGRIALLDRAGPEMPCIFYEEGLGCRIQTVKPRQCIDFPTRWHDEDSILFCKGLQALESLLRQSSLGCGGRAAGEGETASARE